MLIRSVQRIQAVLRNQSSQAVMLVAKIQGFRFDLFQETNQFDFKICEYRRNIHSKCVPLDPIVNGNAPNKICFTTLQVFKFCNICAVEFKISSLF